MPEIAFNLLNKHTLMDRENEAASGQQF